MIDIPATRVGVVSLGNIGRFHADRLQQLDQSIVGGMDIAEDARDAVANTDGTRTFDTLDELCEQGVEALMLNRCNTTSFTAWICAVT